jgi:hypothetical protein
MRKNKWTIGLFTSLVLTIVAWVLIGSLFYESMNQSPKLKHYQQDGRNLQNLEGENLRSLPAVSPK